MSDIVERLRGRARGYRIGGPKQMAVMLDEAADRIAQLEAALREIDTACSNPGSWSPVVMERIIERVQELSHAALEKST